MTRRSLTQLQRAAIFERFGGLCHLCEQKIQVGQPWDAEHVIPLAMGGEDGGDNLRPAHKACHSTKTAADVAAIAKVKRVRAKHLGARKPSNWPCGRNSKLKRKVTGEVVLR